MIVWSCAQSNGETGLHVACIGGHVAVVEALVEAGADVNAAKVRSRCLHRGCSRVVAEAGDLVIWCERCVCVCAGVIGTAPCGMLGVFVRVWYVAYGM